MLSYPVGTAFTEVEAGQQDRPHMTAGVVLVRHGSGHQIRVDQKSLTDRNVTAQAVIRSSFAALATRIRKEP